MDTGNLVEKALFNIYKKKVNVKTEIEPNLFNITYKQLNLAVDKGFAGIEFNKPNDEFIYQLKHNNAVFSAFKVHREQNDIALQLLDGDGKLKSFAQFKKDAQNIDAEYQKYLKTEYSTAVIRARQAANFKKFEEDKELFPNLKWLPSTSISKRDLHKPFYNLVKPIDDPFWKSNFPGNLWNCKCGLTNTDEPSDEDQPKMDYEPAPGLDENPAFTASIFNNEHNTYLNNGYEKPKVLKKIAKEKADKVAYLPEVLKEYKNGGKVTTSNLVNKAENDYNDLVMIAKNFAKEGQKVEILPKIHFKNELYQKIFKGAYDKKCPDLNIGNSFYEFESFVGDWNKNKISNMLRKGLKQSNKIIIDIRGGYATDNFINKIAADMIKHNVKISEIWVLENNLKARKVF